MLKIYFQPRTTKTPRWEFFTRVVESLFSFYNHSTYLKWTTIFVNNNFERKKSDENVQHCVGAKSVKEVAGLVKELVEPSDGGFTYSVVFAGFVGYLAWGWKWWN